MQLCINDYILTLLPEKAIYIPHMKALAIADVHLGKARHFRREGLPMPLSAQDNDYERLAALIDKYSPQQVLFLGDLFHSTFNRDWDSFRALIERHQHLNFVLLRGNHDIIDQQLFETLGIEVLDALSEGIFLFTHKPATNIPEGFINLCGHLHPGVVLNGPARQRVRLACFYRQGAHFILPAFGSLTGLAIMEQKKGDSAFGILPETVCRLF
ncbi:ligase-associated DNA damage response endonuclease PdeM [Rurimicrobium arvi]|uniref:Ligase-associated DNA damage response endonuclease PdeM n=2 Tax=Rurimicrobium arvi TaxID=2049916 RepID=A0ABP8MT35_9BACT